MIETYKNIVVFPTRFFKTRFQQVTTESDAERLLDDFFYHGSEKHLWWKHEETDGKVTYDGWVECFPSQSKKAKYLSRVHTHLYGTSYGIVARHKDKTTRQLIEATHVSCIAVDPDRHKADIAPDDHIRKVMKVSRIIKTEFGQVNWAAAEVNDTNGSAKMFGFTKSLNPIPMAEAKGIAKQIHERLLAAGLGDIEVFPHNSKGIGLPMRVDKPKTTIVSGGVLKRVVRRRQEAIDTGRYKMVDFETYSAKAFCEALVSGQPYDDWTLLKALKEGCAAMPYQPGDEQEDAKPVSKKENRVLGDLSDVPKAYGDYKDDPDSFRRHHAAMMDLSRRLGRVATVEEGLAFIQRNNLYTGVWQDNEGKREWNVEYLLDFVSHNFDSTKCGYGEIKPDDVEVGQFSAWATAFAGEIRQRPRLTLDEYGEVVSTGNRLVVKAQFVSTTMSVLKFCLMVRPNEDGCSLPEDYAEYVWDVLYRAGKTSERWNRNKWAVVRDWLEQRGVLKIDRNWHFDHGNGQSMRFWLQDEFHRLPKWWKRDNEPSFRDAVPLRVFLGMTNTHTHHYLTVSRTSGTNNNPETSSKTTNRGPPDT